MLENELCLSKNRPRTPWNKGKLIGAKPPLRPKHVWSISGNLRAVQLLLGHTKIESTVRYLGIELDDALGIAEQIDV